VADPVRVHQQPQHQEQRDLREPGHSFKEMLDIPSEPGSAIKCITRKHKKIDIGSLSPDSTSSRASRRSGSAAPARRSNTATAAASVGAAAAPASKAPRNGTPSARDMKRLMISAVTATPIVASRAAGQNAQHAERPAQQDQLVRVGERGMPDGDEFRTSHAGVTSAPCLEGQKKKTLITGRGRSTATCRAKRIGAASGTRSDELGT
jgi:hypothetical protein